MKNFQSLKIEELKKIYEELSSEYTGYKERGLSLDLSRGKPNSDQIDVSQGILSTPITREDCSTDSCIDVRNYGEGLSEMKDFFSSLLGIKKEYIYVGGNSSLQLMHDTIARAMLFGLKNSPRPWCKETGLKWICVVPGYDRHFAITEIFGLELISVKMTETGPDMDEVERLVKDEKVKGIWCVPKYSNPTGNTYSDETVKRLASMKCAAPDFTIMWDNAYAVHDLTEDGDKLLNIFDEAEKCGNVDRVFYYSSTSKITFPGGGVSFMAASVENLAYLKPYMAAQTIGYDKINQIRHLKFFKNAENVKAHMMRHAEFIREKFCITLTALSALDGLGIAEWTKPRGGYFVSLDLKVGSAKRVFELMKNAGVVLTSVGATYPYKRDPEDKNLRIAPTYPKNCDLKLALEILVVAIKMAAIEKLISE